MRGHIPLLRWRVTTLTFVLLLRALSLWLRASFFCGGASLSLSLEVVVSGSLLFHVSWVVTPFTCGDGGSCHFLLHAWETGKWMLCELFWEVGVSSFLLGGGSFSPCLLEQWSVSLHSRQEWRRWISQFLSWWVVLSIEMVSLLLPLLFLVVGLFWLCGARECSMASTILQPLSAQSVLLRKSAFMRVGLLADSWYFLQWLLS